MFQRELTWFFVTFAERFRQGTREAFEVVMLLALGHLFGCYNPKQFAEHAGIPHQNLYKRLKSLRLYLVKRMLFEFMVAQAAERLKAVVGKSAATVSRANIGLRVDNSVIDRVGRLLRCTWSWYSGRFKKVLNGQDLLGVVLTVGGMVFPLHLLFCSKQGRANTDKPSLLLSMLAQLKEAFQREGIDITAFPITLDSWFVSQPLREALLKLGFTKIILAGKGNYVFTGDGEKRSASGWKKHLTLTPGLWGIDVPAKRMVATSPTFGKVGLLFYQKATTRNYYLIDFSKNLLRGAEIWHIWKQHSLIEAFWKLLKSTFKIKEMRLQGDGLYTGLLIKIVAYLLAINIKMKNRTVSNAPLPTMLRTLARTYDLRHILEEHFHGALTTTY